MVLETNMSEILTHVEAQNRLEKSEATAVTTLKVEAYIHMCSGWGYTDYVHIVPQSCISPCNCSAIIVVCVSCYTLSLTQSTVSSAPNKALSAVKNIQSTASSKLPGKISSLKR